MIQINQEPFGKVHFSTIHLTLSKPCCNDAQPAIFVNSVYLGWFYCCSIAINSFSGAVVCFTYLQPFEAMNMNFSCEICAVQVRTAENKNRIESEFSLIKRLPIDSHVQQPMCSHMKMLCAMWTHTGCCCCCSRIVISHHALLSCVMCLFHSHSLLSNRFLVDVGLWPTQTQCYHIQCNATASICWTLVDSFFISMPTLVCMCKRRMWRR